jgi:uncharacterized protein (DUF1778 family)
MISIDIMPKRSQRTALLIHCSHDEADAIRAAAKKQERTISAYVLRAVRTRLNVERQLEEKESHFFEDYLKKTRTLLK